MSSKQQLVILLFAGFFVRILLAPFGTLGLDFNTFRAWSDRLVQLGPGQFYEAWSDYLPGYLYVLWGLGEIHKFLPIPDVLLYKFPAILADLGTGILIFLIVSRFRPKVALIAAALYLFNPAVIANSTLWGQVDGITALSIIASLFFIDKWPLGGAISLGIGALVKPQAAFIAPIIGILWLKNFGLRKTIAYSALPLVIFLIGFIPFSGSGQSFMTFVFERLSVTANQYPYTSVNAFNFWAIVLGMWNPDVGGPQIIGIVITILTLLFVTWRSVIPAKAGIQRKIRWTPGQAWDDKGIHVFLLAAMFLLVSFLFLTRMHERHLLPVLAPLVIAAVRFPILWIPYAILSITYLANLHYSFIWISEDFKQIFSREVIWLFSALNLGAVGIMISSYLRPAAATRFSKTLRALIRRFVNNTQAPRLASLQTSTITGKKNNSSSVALHFSKRLPSPSLNIPELYVRPILIGILSFAFLSRVAGLWWPSDFYFDEVYHAFTAREILRGNPAAWEWWSDPPEGFAYEWTHPPLAKLGMVGGMRVIGEKSFGWRLPGALLGVGSVFLVYLLGVHLFKSRTVGIFSSAVFALDGLPLVMSRIGMNDSYFLFFALGTILFFLKEKYLWSSIFFGLATASKWSTVWVGLVLFLAMVLLKLKPRWRIFWFLVIPPLVYLASYIPFFTSGHTLSQFIGLQQQMWWYHTGLEATHSYQSSWWTWPLNLRPVWLFVESKDSLIANIYILGNPIVFWLGLVALGVTGVVGIIKRQRVLLFIVVSWGLLFLPWAASPRVMFLYHYLPAIPFLSIGTGWFIAQQKKNIVFLIFLLFVICYLLFYPHWTGIFIPKWLDELYYILPNWR